MKILLWRPTHTTCISLAMLTCWLGFSSNIWAAQGQRLVEVGVAKIDITPAYPIRLSGYAVRKQESEGVLQHLWAKALVIGKDREHPVVLLTVDNTGVPAFLREQLVQRLRKYQIDSDHLALCSSHSHTAPCLAGNLPTLFGEPLPADHQSHIERYTKELLGALEKVTVQALKNRRPCKLMWGQTKAGFAANRRTQGGPVDHDLPVLAAITAWGSLHALVASYACHCTTLDGVTNQICGDWAGYAQEYLERDHRGTVALVTIGCGADANPKPRTGLDFAKQHGEEIATAVNQLLRQQLKPLSGSPTCRAKQIQLSFDKLPTRQEWEEKARQTNYVGYYARVNLAKLDRGEALPTKLDYLVQTWTFGEALALVFLPGEVVVDYSSRLKREFDPSRLWVNAYANDVPCYIPSERILKEGGYEGGGAMVYYDKPGPFAPGIEQLIIGAVHEVLPEKFRQNQ